LQKERGRKITKEEYEANLKLLQAISLVIIVAQLHCQIASKPWSPSISRKKDNMKYMSKKVSDMVFLQPSNNAYEDKTHDKTSI
jgi:hypothetical protein